MNHQDMIVATTATIDGFRIIEQCGLVFGDAVYTQNFMARHNSRSNDNWNLLLWSSENSDKTTALIIQARQAAYETMLADAKGKNANAIVSVIANTNIGNDLIHVTLYGTAVKVITYEEYENRMKEKENAQKEVEEKRRQEIETLQRHKASRDMSRETNFLKQVLDMDSVLQIWFLWQKTGLGKYYTELDEEIKRSANYERMYGKIPNAATKLKNMMKETLLS